MNAFLKNILPYFFCSLAAYLAGTVNFAWLIARSRGIDIRAAGSGNPGTTNAGRVMGLSTGVLVFVGDVLKSAAMVFAARFLFTDSPCIGAVTALACVLGHMYPFYLDFQGGKGIAVLLGAALGTDLRVFILLLLVIAAVAVLSDMACVVLPEGIRMEAESLQKARDEGMAVLTSPLTAYEICGKLAAEGVPGKCRM